MRYEPRHWKVSPFGPIGRPLWIPHWAECPFFRVVLVNSASWRSTEFHSGLVGRRKARTRGRRQLVRRRSGTSSSARCGRGGGRTRPRWCSAAVPRTFPGAVAARPVGVSPWPAVPGGAERAAPPLGFPVRGRTTPLRAEEFPPIAGRSGASWPAGDRPGEHRTTRGSAVRTGLDPSSAAPLAGRDRCAAGHSFACRRPT